MGKAKLKQRETKEKYEKTTGKKFRNIESWK